MEAVTRKQKILDGQDLPPISRYEYFLKKTVTDGGGGGAGIQILRPLKIKDLPPVPQGLTPLEVYDMTDSEAYAPVYFLYNETISNDQFIPVVTKTGSDVVYTPSYFEMKIGDQIFLTPSSIFSGEGVGIEKAPDDEESPVAIITAGVLPVQILTTVQTPGDLEIAAIDVSTIEWVRFNDK